MTCAVVTTVTSSDSAYGRLDPDDINLTVFERHIFLPIVVNGFVSAPDLMVDDLQATSTGVTVTIRNAGSAATVDEFWVDVYFDPAETPAVNTPWEAITGQGAVWGVTQPLQPGESLTLSVGDAAYHPGKSSPLPFPASGSPLDDVQQ